MKKQRKAKDLELVTAKVRELVTQDLATVAGGWLDACSRRSFEEHPK